MIRLLETGTLRSGLLLIALYSLLKVLSLVHVVNPKHSPLCNVHDQMIYCCALQMIRVNVHVRLVHLEMKA